jgi:hypothetical protein
MDDILRYTGWVLCFIAEVMILFVYLRGHSKKNEKNSR